MTPMHTLHAAFNTFKFCTGSVVQHRLNKPGCRTNQMLVTGHYILCTDDGQYTRKYIVLLDGKEHHAYEHELEKWEDRLETARSRQYKELDRQVQQINERYAQAQIQDGHEERKIHDSHE